MKDEFGDEPAKSKTRAELQDDLRKYGITPRPGHDPKGPNLPDNVPDPSTTRAKYADKSSGGGGGGAGIPKVGPKKPMDMKKGGVVSSASKRADGCCTKGKTKGRMV